jgi:hypothetical protein
MPRICVVCSSPKRAEIENAILSGGSVYELERKLSIGRSAIERHRRKHMQQVAENRAIVIERDRAARTGREVLKAAAASDEPPVSVLVEALLGTRTQALKIRAIEERLERVAAVAEADKASQHVAALSGQQLRAVEVGSRLAGNPNFAPRANEGSAGGGQAPFSITINLGRDGAGNEKTVEIKATPTPVQPDPAVIIDGELGPEAPETS